MARAFYATHTRLKKPVVYRDFLTNLDRNPATGGLETTTNEEAVKEGLKNMILTNIGERPYSRAGTRINSLLFEPMNSITISSMQEEIRSAVQRMPRIENHESRIEPMNDLNAYAVTILFKMVNIPEQITLSFFLNRVR